MAEDEKMFQIGLWMLGAAVVLVIALQVCYRTQNRSRDHVRREIVRTQQEIAARQADFAALVRPEILRNTVATVVPNTETISFHKSVSIDELPMKE